jgi:uncharacterized sodium:solute symporter family permease YidK
MGVDDFYRWWVPAVHILILVLFTIILSATNSLLGSTIRIYECDKYVELVRL